MVFVEQDTKKNNSLRLSVSKVKTFSDCQKKFYYTYILKLPRKDHEYFVFGKFMHKVLEDFHQTYLSGSEEAFSKVMSRVFKTTLKEYKMTIEAKKEAYNIIDAYLQKISIEKELMDRISHVEKNFDFSITNRVVLNGMIDRVGTDPDGIIHIADYKTTKNKKYLKNDFFQLLTYAYVIASENPTVKKIRGSYILLRHNFEHITKEFDIEEILEVKGKYENYAKMIEEEKLWTANPTRLCKFCDHVDICEDGKQFASPKVSFGEQKW